MKVEPNPTGIYIKGETDFERAYLDDKFGVMQRSKKYELRATLMECGDLDVEYRSIDTDD